MTYSVAHLEATLARVREQLVEACSNFEKGEPFGVIALEAAERFLEREIARRNRLESAAERLGAARRSAGDF